MSIDLGTKVRDILTGFTGTATARCVYLGGVSRVQVEPQVGVYKKDEAVWFEESRIEAVDAG